MNLRSLFYFVALFGLYFGTLYAPKLGMLAAFAAIALFSHLQALSVLILGPNAVRIPKAAYMFGGYSYLIFTILLDIKFATNSIMDPVMHWLVFVISPHHPDSDKWSVDFAHSLLASEIMVSILISVACYWIAIAYVRHLNLTNTGR